MSILLLNPSKKKKYKNLTINGGFENSFVGWSMVGSVATIDTTIKLNGLDSAKLIANSTTSEVQQSVIIPNGHLVYVCVNAYLQSGSYTPNNFTVISNYVGTTLVSLIGSTTLSVWQKLSTIVTSAYGGIGISLGRASAQTVTVNFDNVYLVDLTAQFGIGNEPSQTWCDANLPFI